jgi:hypothetical protein
MSTDNSTDTDSPFNIWWVVSGVVLVLVVIALIVVLIFGEGGKKDTASTTPAIATSEPAPSGSTAETSSPCLLDDRDQDIPVVGPRADWEPQTYLLVPQSNEFGPSPLPGSQWACFAHSPTGALFAAANVVAGAAGADYETFMADAAISNAALEAWIAGEDPAAHTQEAGEVAQFSGFQMLSVEDDAVVVNLSLTQDSVDAAVKVSLVWNDADGTWNLDMATSDFDFKATDLTGFTKWAATDGR